MAYILIVDDELGIRDLLSEVLDDEGYEVVSVESATRAREARDQRRPDLVLLDIWMPDMDGISLLREWASRGQLDMPVVMMSGHASIETAVEATRIGAVDFLEKPISLAKLTKTISAALAVAVKPSAPPPAGVGPAETSALPEERDPSTPLPSASDTPLPLASSAEDLAPSLTPIQRALLELDFEMPLRELRDAFERIYFEHQMARDGGNMTRLAERSGLERTHLYRKIRQLGLEPGRQGQRKAVA